MTAVDMARKKTAFRLDERILEAMGEASKASGRSRNGWLEQHLFTLFKSTGYIDTNQEPLGETRGGDRTQLKAEDSKND